MTAILAAELHAVIEQVVPHMSDDDTLPVINSIHLEVADGYLFATATDRFTVATARADVAAEAHWTNVHIPAEQLATVQEWLKAAFGTVTIDIVEDNDAMAVTFQAKGSSLRVEYNARAYKRFPDWRKLLLKALGDAKPVPMTGVTTKYLARWEKAAKIMHFWQSRPDAPIVFMDEMGHFIGMQMPVRHDVTREGLLAKWQSVMAPRALVKGQEYRLDIEWADAQGDPWRYTGRDTAEGEPLMQLVGIAEDHPLGTVITEFGPLTPAA
ncbi:phiSA1p31-related protein [Streptomyces rochei]|uniref:DNA polymerase III subunit beta family protein n=1 Tax=Streptomyces rochei TaxID=1928 RepID=UPI0036820CAA